MPERSIKFARCIDSVKAVVAGTAQIDHSCRPLYAAQLSVLSFVPIPVSDKAVVVFQIRVPFQGGDKLLCLIADGLVHFDQPGIDVAEAGGSRLKPEQNSPVAEKWFAVGGDPFRKQRGEFLRRRLFSAEPFNYGCGKRIFTHSIFLDFPDFRFRNARSRRRVRLKRRSGRAALCG